MTLHTFIRNAASTVTRTMGLAEPADEAQIARLAELEGVVEVTASPNRTRLELTYDVRGTVMAALERGAIALGIKPSTGLFARLRRKWVAFQDENLRAQAKVEHHCCSSALSNAGVGAGQTSVSPDLADRGRHHEHHRPGGTHCL